MAHTPILLTGYDAKRCARRVHNEWDPTIEQVEWEVPPDLQMRFRAGIEFEAAVFGELAAGPEPAAYVDLSDVRGKEALIEATVSALDDDTTVILGGWLPDDVEGGRTGRPDILLRVGPGVYVPGDVKSHQVTSRRKRGLLTYSLMSEPGTTLEVAGLAAQTTTRFDDYLQLAHYWRILEAIGRAPDWAPTGFIIGTDQLTDFALPDRILTWMDLSAPLFATFSRSRGAARRSALERYDHEQGFRLKVAAAAAEGAAALVQPIFTVECDSCPWYEFCRDLTGVDTASNRIRAGRLSVREWHALAALGVVSIDDLADLDLDDEAFRASYLPEVAHLKDPWGRLTVAVRRAGMTRDGVLLERDTVGPIALPRADVEIDFDIEWDPEDRVYLWGALVNRPGADPEYHPVVSWQELDDAEAVRLAAEFADWLRGQMAVAEAAGQTLLVYHYSHPEPTYLRRLLGEEAVADLVERFVDLLPIVREHFFGLHGLGIKKVAPVFGFAWRDEDPGGLQSQLWLAEARAATDEAVSQAGRQRILDYNEDDVRATRAIREGL